MNSSCSNCGRKEEGIEQCVGCSKGEECAGENCAAPCCREGECTNGICGLIVSGESTRSSEKKKKNKTRIILTVVGDAAPRNAVQESSPCDKKSCGKSGSSPPTPQQETELQRIVRQCNESRLAAEARVRAQGGGGRHQGGRQEEDEEEQWDDFIGRLKKQQEQEQEQEQEQDDDREKGLESEEEEQWDDFIGRLKKQQEQEQEQDDDREKGLESEEEEQWDDFIGRLKKQQQQQEQEQEQDDDREKGLESEEEEQWDDFIERLKKQQEQEQEQEQEQDDDREKGLESEEEEEWDDFIGRLKKQQQQQEQEQEQDDDREKGLESEEEEQWDDFIGRLKKQQQQQEQEQEQDDDREKGLESEEEEQWDDFIERLKKQQEQEQEQEQEQDDDREKGLESEEEEEWDDFIGRLKKQQQQQEQEQEQDDDREKGLESEEEEQWDDFIERLKKQQEQEQEQEQEQDDDREKGLESEEEEQWDDFLGRLKQQQQEDPPATPTSSPSLLAATAPSLSPAVTCSVASSGQGGCDCCDDPDPVDEFQGGENPTLWLSLPAAVAESLVSDATKMHGVVEVLRSGSSNIGVVFDASITGPRRLFEQFPDGVSVYHPSRSAGSGNTEVLMFLLCLALTVPLVVQAFILKSFDHIKLVLLARVFRGVTVEALIGLFFATPVVVFGGRKIFIAALAALRRRTLNVPCLISLSVSVAYVYSVVMILAMIGNPKLLDLEAYFETPAVLLTLVLLGKMLEGRAIRKTRDVVDSLRELQDESATLADGTELPVELLEVGDVICVEPGARIATDGQVVGGSTSVDESLISGEAIPVAKFEGDAVLGGTINQTGSVRVRVTRIVAQSTLSRVIQLVTVAQRDKVPAQLLADRISTYFVPAVLSIAIITFVVWMAVTRRLLLSIRFAITVLVISCPCGVALAVPSAVVVATGIAARSFQTLVKGGSTYEAARRVDSVIFDKTGTLTKGEARVTSFTGDPSALKYLHAAEAGSEHVLGRALVAACEERNAPLPAAYAFEALPGKGVECIVEGCSVAVGNMRLMQELQVSGVPEVPTGSSTVVHLAVDGRHAGMLTIADRVREEAHQIVGWLKRNKYDVWIVSGDNIGAVHSVATTLGIPLDNCRGDTLPQDKSRIVDELHDRGAVVLMVGDGINDSIALAAADVGASMGVGGTDIARDASDAVLLSDSVSSLPALFTLSEATFRVITFNFAWSFLYNVIGMLIASGAFYRLGFSLHPALAGASEIVSTLPVLLASMSLRLWYRQPKVD